MRLDKYLKVSRIIKRRTIAKEICDNGRVCVNGKIAKAAEEVKIGDVLTINSSSRSLNVKVLNIKEVVRADEANLLYEIISINKDWVKFR